MKVSSYRGFEHGIAPNHGSMLEWQAVGPYDHEPMPTDVDGAGTPRHRELVAGRSRLLRRLARGGGRRSVRGAR
jgi:hypothetical protein